MEIFTKKKFWVKLLISLMAVITIYNFSAPTFVRADWGGALVSPLSDLIVYLGDGIMWGIQKGLFGLDNTFLNLYVPGRTAWKWALLILGGIAAIAAIVFTGGLVLVALLSTIAVCTFVVRKKVLEHYPDDWPLPIFLIGPQEIFSNQIRLLDINFFKPKNDEKIVVFGHEYANKSAAKTIRPVVIKWYAALRNFAIVALMIILMYIGIRIIISSTSKDKAKYKERLVDWLIAMCLLFFMHYIMYFSVYVVEKITEGLSRGITGTYVTEDGIEQPVKGMTFPQLQFDLTDEFENKYKTKNPTEENAEEKSAKQVLKDLGLVDSEEKYFYWSTNATGEARIDYATTQEAPKIYHMIIYGVLVLYTVMFLVSYIRRLIYMTFLTMIAPLVAMTYPLDKIHDGNAQAFSMWLKEYIFNLLIQPFHLIIYMIIVESISDFSMDNPIYRIVAVGFMLQAEKLMRRFFGFDKAQTASATSATSAAVMGGLAANAINKLRKSGHHSGGGGNEKDKKEKDNGRVRDVSNRVSIGEAFGSQGEQQEGNSNSRNLPTRNANNSDTQERSIQTGNADNANQERQTWEDYSQMPGAYYDEYGELHLPERQNEELIQEQIGNANSNEESNPFTLDENNIVEGAAGITGSEVIDNIEENDHRNPAQSVGRATYNPDPSRRRFGGDKELRKAVRKARRGGYWAQTGKRASGRLKNFAKGTGNMALKLAPGLALGALAGSLGLIANLASGKGMEDVIRDTAKATTAGAVVGASMAPNIDKMMKESREFKEMNEERKQKNLEMNDEGAAEAYENYLADRASYKDKELRTLIAKKYNKELEGKNKKEKKEFIDARIASVIEYNKAGITDDKIIIKTMKNNDAMFGGPGHENDVTPQKLALARLAQRAKRGGSRQGISDSLKDNNVSDRARKHILNTIDDMGAFDNKK